MPTMKTFGNQTLGAVQGHHRNRAAVLAHLIQIRNQRYVFKILRQCRIVGFLLKLLDRTNKFTDILHAGTRFVAVFLCILALKPYRVDDILELNPSTSWFQPSSSDSSSAR